MKLFLVLFCLTTANADVLSGLMADIPNHSLNEWVDIAIDQMNSVTIDQGYDPIAMDDVEKSISVNGFLFTYEASFRLTSGLLNGLSTMKRTRDVVFSNNATHLNIYLPLGFDTLTVEYDYNVKVLLMKSGGKIFGQIRDCSLQIHLVVDAKTLRITDRQFYLEQLNDISITFDGNMFDWITNNLISIVSPILTPGITQAMQYLASIGLNAIVEGYNDGVDQVVEYTKSYGDEEIKNILKKRIDMLQSISS